ncbi:MAG: UpxY family transcription antiterminator [Nitrospirae bacterium]|nr:UpxY family transcription antiterminator [Nitrospirota bacterium]
MRVVSERAKLYLEEVDSSNDGVCWYALWTRSRHEKHVRDQLNGKGIEPLLPLVRRVSHWKDRKKEVELPLFPGYCFARFAWKDHLAVVRAPGVVQVIGSSGKPEPIPDHEIETIKKLMTHILPYDSHPYLREGMRVRVIRGPLEGVEGILTRKGRHHRVVIGIQLIRQAAVVEVESADVTPL